LQLRFDLGLAELLTVVNEVELVKVTVAEDDEMVVSLPVVLDSRVRGLLGDTVGVEHPLVRPHAERTSLALFRSQLLGLQETTEGEESLEQTSGTLGTGSAGPVVLVSVKVADVGHDGVTVSHVSGIVPPFAQPALAALLGGSVFETLLERLDELRVGTRESGFDSLFGLGKGLLGLVRDSAAEVLFQRLLESGDGKVRHGALTFVHGTVADTTALGGGGVVA